MNIIEIAQLAGVSRATVSRYLNGGYVSEEKKEKIKAVIEETGYRPSAHAQTLRTKRTMQIGVVLPKIDSDSIGRMVSGISSVLSENEYSLLLANAENDEKRELKYLKLLQNNQVDGIILIGTVFTKDHVPVLKEIDVPVVILAQRLEGFACVYFDDYQAAKDLTRLLLAQSRRIGYIGVSEDDRAVGQERKRGFLDALRESGIDAPENRMVKADFSMEAGHEMARQLLEKAPDIDAVFCATDHIAVGASNYIRETGRRIPEDVQITGVGDGRLAVVTTPALTTAHFYYQESGIEAARLLLDMISGSRLRKEIKLGYHLVVRQSTLPGD